MILDEQNVRAVAGDTVPLTFGPVLNSDGTFMNLRGGAARWALGSFRGAAGALLRKATGDGGIVIVEGDSYGRPTFTVAVMLDPGDTRGLRPGKLWHELQVTDAGGFVATVSAGDFTLLPSTR